MPQGSFEHLLRAVWLLVLVLPTVPIGVGWYRVARPATGDDRPHPAAVVALMLVTCSQGLLLLGLMNGAVIGPDYSSRRFTTIFVNLGVMVAATALAAVAGGRLRRVLVLPCVWVTCSWLYVAAVSSAV